MNRTTRRSLIGGAAVLAAAPAAVAKPHPDAAVFAACAAFTEAEAAVRAAGRYRPDDDCNDEVNRQGDAFDAVAALRPVTLAGLQAKAAAIEVAFCWPLQVDAKEPTRADMDPHEWAAWMLLGDLKAMGSAGA